MTDHKKPGVAFWATVVVVVALVTYPLSFGPACWVTSRINRGADLVPVVYRPLTWAMSPKSETAINRVSKSYAKTGAPENWYLVATFDYEPFYNGNPDAFFREPSFFVGWRWGPAETYVPPRPPPGFTPLPPPYLSPPLSDEPGEQLHSPEVGSGRNLVPDD